MLKRIISVLFAVVLMLTAVSCTQTTKKTTYVDIEEDDVPLTIYLTEYDSLRYVIESINKQSLEKKIDMVVFKYDEREEMFKRIKEEMEEGKGPDLVFINSISESDFDFYTMMRDGMFADMDVLIDNSERFTFDRHNKDALDAGIIEGTRCFMPLSYGVDYFVSTKHSFEANELEVPDILTTDKYTEILRRMHDNKNVPNVFGSSIINVMQNTLGDNQFLDKTDELINLIEESKKDSDLWSTLDTSNINSLEGVYSTIFDNDMLFYSPHQGSQFFVFYYIYNVITNMYDKDEVLVYHVPTPDDIKVAYVETGIAINANSNQKNRAFKFVEQLLLETIQSSRAVNLPVHTNSYENLKRQFTYSTFDISRIESFDAQQTAMPQELVTQYLELIEDIDEYRFRGKVRYLVSTVLKEDYDDYFKGNIDCNTLIDNINNQLASYYSQ